MTNSSLTPPQFCQISFDQGFAGNTALATLVYQDAPNGKVIRRDKLLAAYFNLVAVPLERAGWQVVLHAGYGESNTYYYEFDPAPLGPMCVLASYRDRATISYRGTPDQAVHKAIRTADDLKKLQEDVEAKGWHRLSSIDYPFPHNTTFSIIRYNVNQ